MRTKLFGVAGLLFVLICGGMLSFAAAAELSREMKTAIRLYENGRYNDAMDSFMEVLSSGSPSERAVANEYVNKINQKMYSSDENENDGHSDSGGENVSAIGMVAPAGAAAAGKRGKEQEEAKPSKSKESEQAEEAGLSDKPAKKEPVASAAKEQPKKAAPPADEEDEDAGLTPAKPVPPKKAPVAAIAAPEDEDEVVEEEEKPAATAKAKKAAVRDTDEEEDDNAVAVAKTKRKAEAEESEEDAEPVDREAAMAKKIEREIKKMRETVLSKLAETPGVKLQMAEDVPQAVSLDPAKLFEEKVKFRADAPAILQRVLVLMFLYGKAGFEVLPEGAASGEPRIVDMRRAMSIASFFMMKGISPARLKAHLNLSYAPEIYKRLKNASGIVILFDHDAKPVLKQAVITDPESPPELSLGVTPEEFAPGKGDSCIIEFSVIESVSPIASWKFRILHYASGENPTTVHKAAGDAPAYHQMFWNGKYKFFGELLEPGKYVCVLSAADSEGRENVVKKTVTILKSSASSDAAPKQKPSIVNRRPAKPAANKKAKISAKKPAKARKKVSKPKPAQSQEDAGIEQ